MEAVEDVLSEISDHVEYMGECATCANAPLSAAVIVANGSSPHPLPAEPYVPGLAFKPSTAWVLLFKLYALGATETQIRSMLEPHQNP